MNEDTNIMALGVGENVHHKPVLFQYHWDAMIAFVYLDIYFSFYFS